MTLLSGGWVFVFAYALATPAQAVLHSKSSGATSSASRLASYTFDKFSTEFGRAYIAGSAEYRRREAIFQASLERVRAINARNLREGHPWLAGVQRFMDWTNSEKAVLNGYKPASTRHSAGRRVFSSLQLRSGAAGLVNASSIAARARSGGMSRDEGPSIRDQGNCGSCWAISAAEAVEAQMQRHGIGQSSTQVSAQALVNCVPNPQHCGGSGGCDGATGELAYSFMRDRGIPLEYELPYDAATGSCPMRSTDLAYPAAQRVRVSGWHALPSNRAGPLMQALVEEGPVVVAVDGTEWFDYDSGIFDGCKKDAILGHAVLAKGYGEEAGRKYWDIQNSWGAGWGERGHIRLLRHDGDEVDSWCGIDSKPKEGVGCDGGPAQVTVCGMCGLLYDPIIPQGVRLDGASDTASQFRRAASAGMIVRRATDFTGSDDDFKMDQLVDQLRER